ncbi:MAG: alpha/beta hydrolase-fold protein [Saprospiraceae bacterium]|jgi:predicted alpha/beta superfamily hydrolase|nr:alpha/beta hydrolase-fold protein [Saprospiraceae bacterium]
MKLISYILVYLISNQYIDAQWTIIIKNIPASTPSNTSIYIAGSFNNWDPANQAFKLVQVGPKEFKIDLNISKGTYEFKFTRGAWNSVEGTSSGVYIPNRKFSYNGSRDTTYLEINGWEDLDKFNSGKSTAGPNVKIITNNFYIPQLDRQRRIWIYTPPDYDQTIDRLPILYMFDGQNLFDQYTSFAGEWCVDETLDQLFKEQHLRIIVVGIDNGGAERLDEYTPWPNPSYGGGKGDLTIRFIVETLKPYIDVHYRTIDKASSTGLMGSSLGGLLSNFGILHYQNTFHKAGIFSPSFWYSNEAFLQAGKDPISNPLKIYMIGGQQEGSNMTQNIFRMKDSLLSHGMRNDLLKVSIHPDGTHNETYWKREFGNAVTWLFQDDINSIHDYPLDPVQLYPNIVYDLLQINCLSCEGQIIIYDSLGQFVNAYSFKHSKSINVSPLKTGKYFIKFISKEGYTNNNVFIKF